MLLSRKISIELFINEVFLDEKLNEVKNGG